MKGASTKGVEEQDRGREEGEHLDAWQDGNREWARGHWSSPAERKT